MLDYKDGRYIVNYYSSMFCHKPVKLKISRWQFDDWANGMLDKSELEGNKVNLWKLRDKAKVRAITKRYVPMTSAKEKTILDYVNTKVKKDWFGNQEK